MHRFGVRVYGSTHSSVCSVYAVCENGGRVYAAREHGGHVRVASEGGGCAACECAARENGGHVYAAREGGGCVGVAVEAARRDVATATVEVEKGRAVTVRAEATEDCIVHGQCRPQHEPISCHGPPNAATLEHE